MFRSLVWQLVQGQSGGMPWIRQRDAFDERDVWIETWPGQIFDRDPMLIALVDKTTARDSRNALTLAYLRDVAQTNRIHFFGHTFPLDKN